MFFGEINTWIGKFRLFNEHSNIQAWSTLKADCYQGIGREKIGHGDIYSISVINFSRFYKRFNTRDIHTENNGKSMLLNCVFLPCLINLFQPFLMQKHEACIQ